MIKDHKRGRDDEVSRFLSEFTEEGVLGQGSGGVVVRCGNGLDGQVYAIKKARIGTSKEFEYRIIRREVMAFSQLHHPNVVRYHTSWVESSLVGEEGEEDEEDEDQCLKSPERRNLDVLPCMFIQQECCEISLRKVLDERQICTIEDSWKIFRQILEALENVHMNRVMHGDVHAGNFFRHDQKWKLGDFGHARFLGDKDDLIPSEDRCASYHCPDERVSTSNDMYSCSFLLFELLHSLKEPSNCGLMKAREAFKGQRQLPDGFPASHEMKVAILGLVSALPSERPTASDFLRMMDIAGL